MAEGILRHDAGDRFAVYSAGTNPTSLRVEAVEVMDEIGMDIRGQFSKSVDYFDGQEFDFVITVCDHARESCPVLPGVARHIHRSFDDAANATGSYEERVVSFRRIRDEIRNRLKVFDAEHVGLHYAMHG
jgi:arsenate reductase